MPCDFYFNYPFYRNKYYYGSYEPVRLSYYNDMYEFPSYHDRYDSSLYNIDIYDGYNCNSHCGSYKKICDVCINQNIGR